MLGWRCDAVILKLQRLTALEMPIAEAAELTKRTGWTNERCSDERDDERSNSVTTTEWLMERRRRLAAS